MFSALEDILNVLPKEYALPILIIVIAICTTFIVWYSVRRKDDKRP